MDNDENVLPIFQGNSTQKISRELFESLVSVVALVALGQGENPKDGQLACAMWLLERIDSKDLTFRPDSRGK